ncbi:hypothetical protein PP175_06330 [Aneurinibacillus sp. Ricciae_BoGa-3]|uniref:hypothetical protein n=1 Tax=Aneurinibacillus sp. Ricciae_BoGa-3 TaxID=3022697 RepID=UPI002341A7BD|nr:hypothetical protein [Aneurinibacillus sp. Ricciae_BoGa-3]WCK55558.1 hypothetical protein PP175_06330 [Aneurinibacillus sp. Ricciae_BoGa-3]
MNVFIGNIIITQKWLTACIWNPIMEVPATVQVGKAQERKVGQAEVGQEWAQAEVVGQVGLGQEWVQVEVDGQV